LHQPKSARRGRGVSESKPFDELSPLEQLRDYVAHDSWRCKHYNKCHCGLDDLLRKLKLDPIPCNIER
jgi:hypothetical protein